MKESIPHKNADKLDFLKSVSDKITANPTNYGTDADGALAFAGMTTAATVASDEANSHRLAGKGKTSAFTEALSLAEVAFRNMAQQARFNPDVTDENLADIGLSRRENPSRVAPPADAPIVSIAKLMVGLVGLKLQVPEQIGFARPTSAIGAEVSLVDGTVSPDLDDPEKGVKTFVSNTRTRVSTDIGKARVRLYARWLNQRGETSPWSLPVQFSPQQA